MSEWFSGCAVLLTLVAADGKFPHEVLSGVRPVPPTAAVSTLGCARTGSNLPVRLCVEASPAEWLPVAAVGLTDSAAVRPAVEPLPVQRLSLPLWQCPAGTLPSAIELAQAAPDAETGPRRTTSIEHLRQAIEHLRAGGFERDAAALERTLDETRQAQHEALERKRSELETLRCEIAELEDQLGLGNQYLLSLVIGELDPVRLKETGTDLSFLARRDDSDPGIRVRPLNGSMVMPESTTLRNADFKELMDTLTATDAIRIQARPTLVTAAGQTAELHSGGEFPVPVPGANGVAKIEFREFGVKVQAVVRPVNDQRIQLEVTPEVSQRDFNQVVQVDGVTVPGLTTRRINSKVEMTLGRTVILATAGVTEDGRETVWFVACTPERIGAPEAHSSGVRLVPIPEAYRNGPTETPIPR